LYALAAQKYGVISPLQTIYCAGIFTLRGSSHQYRDDKKHGLIDMRHAISRSCDVYFFRVAEKLGIDRMNEFMKTFGYGGLTGIDIPGEKPGLMASPEWKRHAFKRAADQVWGSHGFEESRSQLSRAACFYTDGGKAFYALHERCTP
jgi:penicillin-binding protein 2